VSKCTEKENSEEWRTFESFIDLADVLAHGENEWAITKVEPHSRTGGVERDDGVELAAVLELLHGDAQQLAVLCEEQ
jgi:hypothetical protein